MTAASFQKNMHWLLIIMGQPGQNAYLYVAWYSVLRTKELADEQAHSGNRNVTTPGHLCQDAVIHVNRLLGNPSVSMMKARSDGLEVDKIMVSEDRGGSRPDFLPVCPPSTDGWQMMSFFSSVSSDWRVNKQWPECGGACGSVGRCSWGALTTPPHAISSHLEPVWEGMRSSLNITTSSALS